MVDLIHACWGTIDIKHLQINPESQFKDELQFPEYTDFLQQFNDKLYAEK